jgi:acyl-CoA thioesterase-1
MRLVCLGDSICAGYGVAPGAGWVALLSAVLAAEFSGLVTGNAGVSGEIAEEGLGRLSRALGAGPPDLLYLQFGLHDAAMGVALAEYVGIMRKIAAKALKAGVRAVLVGNNHPVLPEAAWDPAGAEFFRRQVGAFNEALRREFSPPPEAVFFADLERLCQSPGGELAALLQADGVHLSEEGNRAYARLLRPLFRERLLALRGPQGADSDLP